MKSLLSSVISAATLLVLSSSAWSATFTVTKTRDTDDGTCDASNCSLRDAVIAANQNAGADTIVLPAGTYALTRNGAGEDNAATGDLDILEETTIEGDGPGTTIIDAFPITDRIFDVRNGAGDFTLSGVTLRNGNVSSAGGGINFNSPARLILQDCVVSGNSATAGGGINAASADVSISDCVISSNEATADFGGGAAFNSFSSSFPSVVTIENSTITGNTSTSDGGGIYQESSFDGESLTISSSTFSGNASGALAGGIYTDVLTTVTDSVIENNISDTCAGLLKRGDNGPAHISRTAFRGNVVPIGANQGGGVCLDLGTEASTISDSVISNNTAGFGGGLYVRTFTFGGTGVVEVTNTTISGNTASADNGGGFYLDSQGIQATLTNVTLSDNESDTTPSTIILYGTSNITLVNSIIASDSVNDNCGFSGGAAAITSLGHNIDSGTSCGLNADGDLSSTDPLLAALADNGGPTLTQALQTGSPAINAGDSAHCPTTDQRGETRPTACDIGAFELTACGDGVVQTGEACDGGDTCNTDCTLKSDGNGSGTSSGGCSLMR